MIPIDEPLGVEVFSTCPNVLPGTGGDFLAQVRAVARWSEQAGCRGILIYTDNSTIDPWLLAQAIIESTERLSPLVAVQPVYMHPYSVAKMVTSLSYLYDRQIYLNMVAGGFVNDLTALNDHTPHDRRYDRLCEYTTIIQLLLSTSASVSFQGDFYTVTNLKMTPPLPPRLRPGVFVSGSSEAGLAAALKMGATAVKYPRPASELEDNMPEATDSGIRIGIVTRPDAADAWAVAYDRFPPDRKGQLTHELAMKTSDSEWHRQLSRLSKEPCDERNPYWLIPFQNYKTFCPYLVGSYERVAAELRRYRAAGFKKFILDIPPNEEELRHIGAVFAMTEDAQVLR